MLRDEEFSKKAAVDRYGRRLEGDSGRRELERFYRVGGEEEEEDGEDGDEEVEEELRRLEREYDPAREGGFSSSSSEEEEEEEESSADEEGGEDVGAMEEFGFVGRQATHETGVPMGDISSRIAVVNLDWDNIRAADLMAVFSSFVPASGRILKVAVYPSEFGRERMEREEIEGPPKEIFATAESKEDGALSSGDASEEEGDGDEDEDENIKKSILQEDKGEEFDSAKLRRYQLERLRYYYAVLTCSSPTVAKQIYDAVDGTEYLTTANFFDLRFIPDGVDFSDDKPRDECERIPDGYRPNDFVTDALQHSKVRLTWDADDGARKEVQRRAFAGSRAEIDENDLKAYLGSDSSDDEAEEAVVIDPSIKTVADGVGGGGVESDKVNSKASKKEQERQRMRALLGLADTSASSSKRSKASAGGPVGDMQITFSSGLSAAPTKGSVFENEPEREETTVEKYVRKEKERKARRKEKTKDARNNDTTAAEDATNGKEIEQAPADTDLGFEDPFFTAPADDHAAASAQRKAERLAKREQRAADEAASSAQRAELELLMLDDKSSDVKHFDMNEIQKAQKAAGKKKKNRRRKERERPEGEQDGFEMDVKDPRFSSLFESHEFAIDPTNPRFKGTEGMRALLEEGRRKRSRGGVDEEVGEDKEERREGKRKRVRMADTDAGDGDGEELQRLVERVKGKTRKKTTT